jgi:hypothetical protein
MLTTLGSIAVKQVYLWWLSSSDAYHRNLHIGTESLHLFFQGIGTFAMVGILKVQNKTMNKDIKPFFQGNISHSPTGKMLDFLRRDVFLLRNSSLRT